MGKIAIGLGCASLSAALRVLVNDSTSALAVLLFAFIFIAWGIVDELRNRREEENLSLASPSVPQVLPEHRPKVVPDRYGISPNGLSKEGLHLVNHGEAALEVQVEPVRLADGWVLHFDDVISHLSGAAFMQGVVSRDNHHSMSLDGVWRSLREVGDVPAILPLNIKYKDFNGRWYRSICELHRDVMKNYPGFDVKFVRQEAVSMR